MHELILIEIIAVPAERSRGRHNPRVVKRKMSSFPTKARAAPPSGQLFRYEEHIRIVAPAGSPADHTGLPKFELVSCAGGVVVAGWPLGGPRPCLLLPSAKT
jgi:hypothetical protein